MAADRSTPGLRSRACRPTRVECTAALLAAIWLIAAPQPGRCWQADPPATESVRPGQPLGEFVEGGTIESASSVTVRCDVSSSDNSGATILELIPEGTLVQPGDLLVRLDSSALEDDLARQQILVAGCSATVRRALGDCEAAKLAMREYTEGIYVLELQSLRNQIFVAEEQLRRANEDLTVIEQQAEEKSVAAARFAVRKAQNELELAQMKLQVLEKFTKAKILRQLEADLEVAESRLQVDEAGLHLARERLDRIESQIESCLIKAPRSGSVVYANVPSSRTRAEIVIEEGAQVRPRQPILRLDDLARLQVQTRIHESRVTLLQPGMPAKIRVDAFPDRVLTGTVIKVNEFPEPPTGLVPGARKYATIIRIDDPAPELRVGLTAEVRIFIRNGTGTNGIR